jgi:uncharacterized protein (UPF0333 family)
MFAVLVALVLLFAGVAVIYLLLKKMSEEGIDIAAPGSCKRGRCGVPNRPLVEEAEEAPLQAADVGDQGKPNS